MSSEEIIILDVEEKVFGGYMEKGRKKEIEWGVLASKLFCGVVVLFCVLLAAKYALGALLPFALAYCFSLVIDPIASAVSKKARLPKKLCAFVCLSLIILALGALIACGLRRLALEMSELFESASRGEGTLAELFGALWEALSSLFERLDLARIVPDGAADGRVEEALELISSAGERLITEVGERFFAILGGLLSASPSFLLGTAVTIIATYYFCLDKEKIDAGLRCLIPKKHSDTVLVIAARLRSAAKRYARAYLFLTGLTFLQTLVGLSLLKVRYALLVALGIALVDLLPVLGAGVALVPWAIAAFLLGNTRLGVGLLVLYGTVTVVRQIAEPHVIGTSIGLHPAAALFSSYVGLKLFGFLGIILGPAAAFMISEVVNAGKSR